MIVLRVLWMANLHIIIQKTRNIEIRPTVINFAICIIMYFIYKNKSLSLYTIQFKVKKTKCVALTR